MTRNQQTPHLAAVGATDWTGDRDLSDAEWAAAAAIAALQSGRYRLGLTYAEVAHRAHQDAQRGAVHVPMRGQTREDHPREPAPADPYARLGAVAGPGARAASLADADLGRMARDAEAIMAAAGETSIIPTPQLGAERSARCRAVVMHDGITGECHKVVAYMTLADPAGWYHLDPYINDHMPVVDL